MNQILLISSGFALGLIGSLHCLGMCGPLVLMAHGASVNRGWSAFWGATLPYHAGRIMVYTLLASVLGGLVDAATLPSWQGPLSIFSGIALLAMYFWGIAPSNPMSKRLSSWTYQLFAKQKPQTMWLAGAINGLLPCGLSLAALVAASSQGTALSAAWFMLGFGLGTSPALIALVGLGASMPEGLRRVARRVAPYTVLVVGLLLLLRGANLGIPFLSPKWDSMHMQAEGPQSSNRPTCCH
jgi:sulfite exporter TauE/SafE